MLHALKNGVETCGFIQGTFKIIFGGTEDVFEVVLSMLLFGECFGLNCLLNHASILAFENYLEQIETETESKLATT